MRLIAADKLEDVLAKHQALYYGDSDYYEGISQGFNLAIYDVKEAQTIDAEPIKIGHWIEKGIGIAECDVCNRQNLYRQDGKGIVTKYCPYCGARMDEE